MDIAFLLGEDAVEEPAVELSEPTTECRDEEVDVPANQLDSSGFKDIFNGLQSRLDVLEKSNNLLYLHNALLRSQTVNREQAEQIEALLPGFLKPFPLASYTASPTKTNYQYAVQKLSRATNGAANARDVELDLSPVESHLLLTMETLDLYVDDGLFTAAAQSRNHIYPNGDQYVNLFDDPLASIAKTEIKNKRLEVIEKIRETGLHELMGNGNWVAFVGQHVFPGTVDDNMSVRKLISVLEQHNAIRVGLQVMWSEVKAYNGQIAIKTIKDIQIALGVINKIIALVDVLNVLVLLPTATSRTIEYILR